MIQLVSVFITVVEPMHAPYANTSPNSPVVNIALLLNTLCFTDNSNPKYLDACATLFGLSCV